MIQKGIRFPDDLADQVDLVARAAGLSINAFVNDAVRNEIARRRSDPKFVAVLNAMNSHDRTTTRRA